jgi:membrane protein YdbS with pleckstrin-like domain
MTVGPGGGGGDGPPGGPRHPRDSEHPDGSQYPDEGEHPRHQHDTDPLPVLARRVVVPPPGPGAPRRAFGSRRSRARYGPPNEYSVYNDVQEALKDSVALDDEGDPIPSEMVGRYLFTNERFCGEWRRHWTFLWKEIVAIVAATFVLGYVAGTSGTGSMLAGVAGVAWAALALWVAWQVGDWYFDRFVLTSRRVMVVAGMVTRKVAMMPLARVTDMAYNQSPLGRMLGYGTFILESAGQEQALREINHLPDPRELYLLMVEEMYGPDPNPRRTRTRRDTTRDTTSGGD